MECWGSGLPGRATQLAALLYGDDGDDRAVLLDVDCADQGGFTCDG